MPIPVNNIVASMASQLDAEGSDRYTFAQDYVYAINYAINFSVAVFNRAFADNKISPESLRELTRVKIWQASQYSRVNYDPADTGHNLWTLLAIYPDAIVNGNAGVIPASPEKSIYRPNLSYLSADKSAKRLSFEQWNSTKKNIFIQGNNTLQGELKEYAYLDMADYNSSTYTVSTPEFEIRPSVAGKIVAMAYLKSPNEISTINDNIEFPDTMFDFLTQQALRYIAHKQGDQTTLYMVTSNEINQLATLFRI